MSKSVTVVVVGVVVAAQPNNPVSCIELTSQLSPDTPPGRSVCRAIDSRSSAGVSGGSELRSSRWTHGAQPTPLGQSLFMLMFWNLTDDPEARSSMAFALSCGSFPPRRLSPPVPTCRLSPVTTRSS